MINTRNITKEVLWSSIGPLRVIELLFALGPIIPLSWETTADIFNGGIWFLIAANVGFIMFTERDLLKKGRLKWIYSIVSFSLTAIAIEVTGIFVHTATVFMQDPSVVRYYENVSLAFVVGGYGFTLLRAFTRRYDDKKISDDKAMVLFVILIVALAGLMWFDYEKNPLDPLRMLVNWLVTL